MKKDLLFIETRKKSINLNSNPKLKTCALPRTSPMFLSVLKNTIISPILRELCQRK